MPDFSLNYQQHGFRRRYAEVIVLLNPWTINQGINKKL